jgi:hypothetical protein
MSDDLADYPIVVLENDYPEGVGKVGLFDYLMPVGSTGIVFVAAVPGRLYKQGPTFREPVRDAANLRAASTLVQMGLMRGAAVAFLRNALKLTQQELADALGVLLADVQAWESDAVEIPRLYWNDIGNRVMRADGRVLIRDTPGCPSASYRGRKIRVFPNIPMPTTTSNLNPSPDKPYPVPPFDPNCQQPEPDCEPPIQ